MARSVRCPCRGNPACRLCSGTQFYEYEPGPHGWQMFPCPTCAAARAAGERPVCVTCGGRVFIDPADPPSAGGWRGHARAAWKVLFGGG